MPHDAQSLVEEVEYWKKRANSVSDECDELVALHRTEADTLRRQCAELLRERSLMKAATASDVRTFILNYQADALRRSGGSHTSLTDAVPVTKLLQFLHAYSNGLVPAPRNERKRDREQDMLPSSVLTSSSSPSGGVTPQRLYQRLMLRRRQGCREHEVEEWVYQQQQAQQVVQRRLDGPAVPDAPLPMATTPLLEELAEDRSSVEAVTEQLQREERERQLQDQRVDHARGDAPWVSVGGGDGDGRHHSKHGHWRTTGSGGGDNPSS